ncbi:MAG: GIY-YIG nuclease family protein [Blastocatellia bacterium]
MSNRKKELINEYKQNPPKMGVYQIRNLINDKVLIGTAINLPGILTSNKFSLNMGKHINKALQSEWNEYGGENFAFEVLDELTPTSTLGQNYREDLAFLEEFWLDKLQPFGERGYNEKKKGKEEMLEMIARNRLSKQ